MTVSKKQVVEKKAYYCPRCKNKLQRETGLLKKKYPFFCKTCDENFFSFEARMVYGASTK
jgi:hypothetical protein